MSILIKQKMKKSKNEAQMTAEVKKTNACPEDSENNCLVPGVYQDSAPIGGG